ncbi:hypothetical protein TNCV_124061 [Trichonephila clavipes]|nr:hypothetical protein TNCV_124061 [Trichonephila clavipes]
MDGNPSVRIGDEREREREVLTSTKRRSVLRAFHDNFQLMEAQNLLAAPSQGKSNGSQSGPYGPPGVPDIIQGILGKLKLIWGSAQGLI